MAKKDPRDIAIGRFNLTATGIEGEVSKPPSLDEFRASLAYVGRCAGATNWWVGDLANLADKWGDEYVQMLDELGLEYKFVRDCAWVSENVPFSIRIDSLSWSHHKIVTALAPAEQRKWLKRAQPKEGEVTPKLSVGELRKAIRTKRLKDERDRNPFPEGTYRVLLADPPWKYSDELIEGYGAAEHHYPTLSTEEICVLDDAAGKAVPALAQDDAVLFLWATSPLLEDALRVVAAWDFSYKTSFVWDKVQHNYGHYNSVRHELLLVATHGSCVPDSDELVDSVVEVDRSEVHSQKPERFYDIIEGMYTEGPYLELFARTQREGWDAWGNQAPKT